METIANRSQSLSPEYSLIAGQKSQMLIIGDAQWSHVGVYRCIAAIDGMTIEAQTSLDVLSKLCMWSCLSDIHYPFVVPLKNMVIRGSNSSPARWDIVTIECNVTANPPANIKWMKSTNQRMQTLVNTQKISFTHQLTYTPGGPTSRSTLTISNVQAADNGYYICEASNGQSSPSLSANFTICVLGKINVNYLVILELYNANFMLMLFIYMNKI